MASQSLPRSPRVAALSWRRIEGRFAHQFTCLRSLDTRLEKTALLGTNGLEHRFQCFHTF